MGWVALALALAGAIIALVSGFGFHNLQGVVVGIVIALIGIWFRPRGSA